MVCVGVGGTVGVAVLEVVLAGDMTDEWEAGCRKEILAGLQLSLADRCRVAGYGGQMGEAHDSE